MIVFHCYKINIAIRDSPIIQDRLLYKPQRPRAQLKLGSDLKKSSKALKARLFV